MKIEITFDIETKYFTDLQRRDFIRFIEFHLYSKTKELLYMSLNNFKKAQEINVECFVVRD